MTTSPWPTSANTQPAPRPSSRKRMTSSIPARPLRIPPTRPARLRAGDQLLEAGQLAGYPVAHLVEDDVVVEQPRELATEAGERFREVQRRGGTAGVHIAQLAHRCQHALPGDRRLPLARPLEQLRTQPD